MSFLEKIFGKKRVDEEEILPSHQGHYDQHAPINLDDWGREEEPQLDLLPPSGGEVSPSDEQRQTACESQSGAVLSIVLTVMAAEEDHFEGSDLLREFNAAGLHIGKDGLFHAYPEQGSLAPLFSVSNVLNPGIFDAQKIMTLQTRGVALFVQLPAAHPGKACFSALVEAANRLATGLGGQIMDADRRLLTNHTLQRLQEQVLEFEYCRELERRKAEASGKR